MAEAEDYGLPARRCSDCGVFEAFAALRHPPRYRIVSYGVGYGLPEFEVVPDEDEPPECEDRYGCFRRQQMNMWETAHGCPRTVWEVVTPSHSKLLILVP